MNELIEYLSDADERPRFLVAVYCFVHLALVKQLDARIFNAYVRGQQTAKHADREVDTSIIAGRDN